MGDIKYKAKRDFKNLPEDEFNEKISKVDDGTTNNPTIFVDPKPTNSVFHSDIAAYHTKKHELEDLEILLAAKKNEVIDKKDILYSDLDTRADYVDSMALGNKQIVLDSGNEAVSNEKHKRPIPPSATGVTTRKTTESGTVIVSCDHEDLADQYFFEESITPMDANSYKLAGSETKSTCILRNRSSGSTMGFRVTLKNASGLSFHSSFAVTTIP